MPRSVQDFPVFKVHSSKMPIFVNQNPPIMYKLKFVISVFALTAVFSACNQASQTDVSAKTDTISALATVPVEIKDIDIDQAFIHYIHLKDLLVASNATEAQAAAKELATALRKIDGCENTATMATEIAGTNDLIKQRFQFTAISSDIIAMLKHTDIESGSLFVQYCPMANDGDGGYWLASEKEIRNPYYGDEMLHCGEVKETITKK